LSASGVVDPAVELLREVMAEQNRQGAMLAAILRAVEARAHRTSDPAESALLVTIAESIGNRPFRCKDLCAHAAADDALRDALEACDITTPRELGWLCRRVEREPVHESIQLERQSDSRAGVVWRLRVSESQTRVD
jgi:hypothetical protein